MLKRLYAKTLDLSASPNALWWMALLAFTESSFFLIPPDTMLVPMCLARRERAMWFALVCTAASVLGGLLGWFIGFALFEAAARPILEFYSAMDAYERFREHAQHWGFWVIALKGLTPIPYKVVAIASGAVGFALPAFVLASFVGRGSRFFLLAWLCSRYGQHAQGFMERNLALVASVMVVALVGGFFLLALV